MQFVMPSRCPLVAMVNVLLAFVAPLLVDARELVRSSQLHGLGLSAPVAPDSRAPGSQLSVPRTLLVNSSVTTRATSIHDHAAAAKQSALRAHQHLEAAEKAFKSTLANAQESNATARRIEEVAGNITHEKPGGNSTTGGRTQVAARGNAPALRRPGRTLGVVALASIVYSLFN
mmetsp:Transcript_122830/g.342265  ORF Transcript_122830/g.342265 Transcript_122830/m.342265 type:complete len:174 (+) Transcript_122830:45-566(+)